MQDWLLVLERSTRAQVAIFIGLIGFVLTLWVGQHMVERVVFEGMLAPLGDALRDKLMGHYEKAAFGVLFSSLFAAWRFLRRDRKRLLGY